MRMLYYAHSGLRYLVLLVGLLAVVYFAYGAVAKRPVTRAVRVLGSVFTGLLDLQIVLGLLLLAFGLYYPALIGHIVLMVLAAGLVHGLLVANRKRATPGYTLPLAAVGGGCCSSSSASTPSGRTCSPPTPSRAERSRGRAGGPLHCPRLSPLAASRAPPSPPTG